MNNRSAALKILTAVILHGKSLTDTLDQFNFSSLNAPWIKEICFGVLRWYEALDFILSQLLQKPLQAKDTDIKIWLMMSLYQLVFMRAPEHAVVSNMVKDVPKAWAKNLTNAILRTYLRTPSFKEIFQHPEKAYASHWLFQKIQKAWPNQYAKIIAATQHKAPLFLRVNLKKISRKDYVAMLATQNIEVQTYENFFAALQLKEALPVEKIPGFSEGLVSVQDLAAQEAAMLLDVQPGMKVLDACAAPGGKTAHLLECADIDLTAVDISEKRCERIRQNLKRLGLSAYILSADAKNLSEGKYDRILLDAPCSATGVIRRHPDIKLHRKPEDLKKLLEEQENLLKALWEKLTPEGLMLYATCSILPEENTLQIQQFLNAHPEARLMKNTQLFPEIDSGDGFYYALLRKSFTLGQ